MEPDRNEEFLNGLLELPEEALIRAPHYMKENILNRIRESSKISSADIAAVPETIPPVQTMEVSKNLPVAKNHPPVSAGRAVIPITRAEKRRRLFLYSLKVTATSAALIAILFLPGMSGAEITAPPVIDNSQTIVMESTRDRDSVLRSISDSTSEFCDRLLQLTNQITKWEVFNHENDQKEK